MKWIGQYIWDFVSRFRNDVYLENLSTSSETNALVVDSDGKITKNTAITDAEDLDVTSDSGTIDIDLNSETLTIGGTANEIETSATGTTVTVGLPNDVTVTGDLTVTGGDIVLGAANSTSSTIKRLSNASGSAGAAFYINGADAVGTNIAGGSIANFGGLGTGTGNPGAHLWYGGVKTGSGSSAQSYMANMLLSHDYTSAGVNTLRVYSSLNTSDWFAIDVAAEGATTLSTIDANTTAAHFEIAADGDITLDANGQIKLEPVAGNNILLDGTVTVDGGSVTGITTLGVDSVSLTAVQTSGESFTDNDTSLMTSASIQDKIEASYSYQYISFLADSDQVVSNQFIVPGANGISSHAWNVDSDLDHTGTDATTIGHANAHITMNYTKGTASIPVPQACELVGFWAVGRNETSNPGTFGIGIFVSEEADVQWGSAGGTWDATLRAYATNTGGGNHKRTQKLDGILGTPFVLSEGDLITPAVVAPTGDAVKATITLVLRTKLTV